LKPNEHFVKSWTFKHTSEEGISWPSDTRFASSLTGDTFGTRSLFLETEVKSNADYTINLSMIAPSLVGYYCAYFMFQFGNRDETQKD
jgi:hypothetical protein